MRLRFGDLDFDGAARLVRRGGEPLHLTPKAIDLLQVLIDQRPAAVSKEALRERLWPDVVVSEANLKNLVSEIRAALGDDATLIRTVHRFGYAFAAAVDAPTAARLVSAARVYRLTSGENVVGRDELCTVLLDVTGVSRRHATIRVSGDRCVVEDLASKNGTWRNGERLTAPVELHDADVLRFGGATVTFRCTTEPESTTTI